ncbi:MAG: hypothetical protein ABIP97_10025 [Chthoniobacterales bacterium]
MPELRHQSDHDYRSDSPPRQRDGVIPSMHAPSLCAKKHSRVQEYPASH